MNNCPFCGSDSVGSGPVPLAEITPRIKGMVFVACCVNCGARIEATSLGEAEKRWNQRSRRAVPWLGIESAPKDGTTVLLGYFNSFGKWRTLRGRYVPQSEIDHEWEEGDGLPEGWYETSVEAEDVPNHWETSPTHWMPLPAPPIAAALPSEQERSAERDMLNDARLELDMLREALGVSAEPHQTLLDRMMDAARAQPVKADSGAREAFEKALGACVRAHEDSAADYSRSRAYKADELWAEVLRLYDARPSAPNDDAREALERDAERYRWLRDEAADLNSTGPLVVNMNSDANLVLDEFGCAALIGKRLDEAIDNARRVLGQGEK